LNLNVTYAISEEGITALMGAPHSWEEGVYCMQ